MLLDMITLCFSKTLLKQNLNSYHKTVIIIMLSCNVVVVLLITFSL